MWLIDQTTKNSHPLVIELREMFIWTLRIEIFQDERLCHIFGEISNFTIVQWLLNRRHRASKILHFSGVDEMLEWITERWRDSFVCRKLEYFEDYDKVAKRPFFLLIELKSRVSDRFARSVYNEIAQLIAEDDALAF